VTKKVSSDYDVVTVLTEWWRELLGVEHVGLDDDFFELGGQSLLVMRLFSKIKKQFGVNLGLSSFFEARTIRELAQLIREVNTAATYNTSSARAIVPIQPKGTRPPLYVMSGLDGHVLAFERMAAYMGDDQPVYGLVPRALESGEPYHTRVEDMAAYYVDAILKAHPEGPYRVVGHSFGGILAFEVAQQLIARGRVVSLLGLFDAIEWHYRERVKKSLTWRDRLWIYTSEFNLAVRERDPFGPLWKRFKAKVSKTIAPFWHAFGLPRVNQIRIFEDVNLSAGENYYPRVYSATLTLFRSTSRGPMDGDDDFLGWGGLVTGKIEVHQVPSTHYTMMQEPAVITLAAKVRGCLDRDDVEKKPKSGFSSPHQLAPLLTSKGASTEVPGAQLTPAPSSHL
jgi:thioesterase domain-containing protein/acyl carrier protein